MSQSALKGFVAGSARGASNAFPQRNSKWNALTFEGSPSAHRLASSALGDSERKNMRRLLITLSLLFAFCLFSLLAAPFKAHAEGSGSGYPDIVRLHDGGFFRGTVVEWIPGEYAIIELRSGELRRVEASEIAYIGASADERPANQEPAFEELTSEEVEFEPEHDAALIAGDALYAEDGSVRIRILSEGRELTLHQIRSEGVISGTYGGGIFVWSPLCTAPCEAFIQPSPHHRMVISSESGRKAAVRGAVRIMEPSDLKLDWINRRPIRLSLWITSAVLYGVGFWAVMSAAFNTTARCGTTSCGLDRGRFFGGVAAFGGALGLMMGAVFTVDRGRITVHPYGSLDQDAF